MSTHIKMMQDSIASLIAQRDELLAALRPFAHIDFQHFSPTQMHEGDQSPIYGKGKAILRLGDFKRAASAIAIAIARAAGKEVPA